MKPIPDYSMLRETTVDSGSLAIISSIVHRLQKNMYRGIVL
ncbi:MAG: hypothetical protein AB9861_01750 [Methanosarcina sp.]|jgi:hypothetical protein